jgi:uncharacterized repeat protein (TIGR03803 family)
MDAAGTIYGVASTLRVNYCPDYFGAVYRVVVSGDSAAYETMLTLDVDKTKQIGIYTSALSVAGDELLVATKDSWTTRGGTIFALHTTTRQTRLLHEFVLDTEGRPSAGPVADVDGSFVGATMPYSSASVVYRLRLNGAFSVVDHLEFHDEGRDPVGSLLRGTDGTFFGSTWQGGGAGIGAVFAVDENGARPVVEFGEGTASWSAAGLARTETGGLLGVTWWGGHSGLGTVFGVEDGTPVTTQASFEGLSSRPGEGYDLRPSRPVLAADGAFYMATARGGAYGEGAIVRHQPSSGIVETTFSFGPYAPPWQSPRRPMALVPGPQARLYGVTRQGGLHDGGIVFSYDPGSSTVVPLADLPQGATPEGGLAVDADGNAFVNSARGVYKVGPQGSVTLLTTVPGGSGGMVLSPDGWLYGATSYGGGAKAGTLFRMRADGTGYEVLHEFTGAADGCIPFGDLSLGPGGVVLGTTAGFSEYTYGACQRNPLNRGSLFQWGSSGFTLLHSFSFETGGGPVSAPIVGDDGALYGTTSLGGPGGGGVLYRVPLAPEVSLAGPYVTEEGSTVSLQATASDPQGGALTYAWDLDGDGQFDDASGDAATFKALDGPATQQVSVRVTDATGLSAVATTTLTVHNVAPTVSIDPPALLLLRGDAGTFTISFSDPGADTWTAHIDYGDKGSETRVLSTSESFSVSHTYPVPGSYRVVVTVTDDDLASGQAVATVDVGSAEANMTWLIGHIEWLIGQGDLKLGQGKSLIGKLELALYMLEWGNTKKAITMLEAFIHEVQAFKNGGVLDAEEADLMIGIAQAAIVSIPG